MRAPVVDIVSRIEQVMPSLSPAERRVGEAVRADYEAATRLSIAELAARAGVSQPSVTRFSRSLGCASFADFKLMLARTLAVALPYLAGRASGDRPAADDVGQLAQGIMQVASQAVLDALAQINSEALRKAIAAIAAARRLDIYGQGGGSSAVAEDARLRFFRMGLPTAAYADGHQQRMSAATLSAGDAVLAISNSGRSKPVIEAVEIARSYGASTVALTRPGTPLARAAEIPLLVAIPDDGNIFRPTPSRYAHLAIVDTLAAGVAMQRGPAVRETLRRVRYTLARIGIAIPVPGNDPTTIAADDERQD
ncbi:MurR/RpiR family transcriptional regulator [Chelatococcus sp. SYSU_G07232]|uniref:MurR/RpiR family transcriptional regulator n=1 Tax=Chelatococcus albus TaxID=3047466 RepID=A0ABT7ALZ2_9HYPH|nr:MurR/RpiR family transcriptional regulator [Chelatococcus sp. SYSU_G07232]MDJ1159967.1 MurR/RpiR family transcriptional regulator [Chelatococcus sp. SYSU_G07232]